MISRIRQALGHPRIYLAVQKGLGTDRVRYRCLDEAVLKTGERVLDVGCGPAYYLGYLPAVDYVGFDTSEHYLAFARRRYGKRGEFRCEMLTESHLAGLGRFDAVLLFGLLHHLDDAQCASLLDLSAKALGPAGRVISVDPVLHAGQGKVSRWISENDRGGYVRRPESYDSLARASFGSVETRMLDAACRIPTSQYIMRMTAPRACLGT